MPRIIRYRFDATYVWSYIGRSITIQQWRKLKKVFNEYFNLFEK